MAGSFLSGLLGGFAESTAASRKQAQDEADKKFESENKVLSMLAASDDPELSRAAISGLVDSTTPRKKGFLDNLIGGKYQPNPALDHIHALIQMGKQVPATPATPGPTVGGVQLPMASRRSVPRRHPRRCGRRRRCRRRCPAGRACRSPPTSVTSRSTSPPKGKMGSTSRALR